MTCDRCDEETSAFVMSMFNTDIICLKCKDLEEAHPKYREAVDADNAECRKGNYNFKGIGLPPELRPVKAEPISLWVFSNNPDTS